MGSLVLFYKTEFGSIFHDDACNVLKSLPARSVDLVVTSPPFGLTREKEYGNVPPEKYIDWFGNFATDIKRVLKSTGSFVVDIGGTWNQGNPTRSLYHFKLMIELCETYGFHLAQEFYWWNPSKLPSPAQWVTVKRVRVKDAVNCIWWLSSTPNPKADNSRVLQPYSESMMDLLADHDTSEAIRPSGHKVSEWFAQNNGAAIPPNILAVANTSSNTHYLRSCKKKGIKPHPARFPEQIPEFFIRMLTDPGDLVVDPFAGSCTTGEVAERLQRKWICCDTTKDYLRGAKERFSADIIQNTTPDSRAYYSIPKLGSGWMDSIESEGRDTPKSKTANPRPKRNEKSGEQ